MEWVCQLSRAFCANTGLRTDGPAVLCRQNAKGPHPACSVLSTDVASHSFHALKPLYFRVEKFLSLDGKCWDEHLGQDIATGDIPFSST